MVNKDTVLYIAKLARLHVDDAEAERFAKNLESILHYADKLNTLDVKDVKPTSHVLNVLNVFREDVIVPSLKNADALASAVDKHNGFYKVPKVIE